MFPDASWVSGSYLHCHSPSLGTQMSEGNGEVRGVVKTKTGYSHAAAVVAQSGCWSMMKGGFSSNTSGPAHLYFESNNTRAEIWADNVSLQPFTHHQWRSHREESIQKVRKRTIHFHAVDARGNNLAGANISVSLVTARFPFVNKDDGVLGDVVAAHYGGLVCSTRDEEWDSWVEAEDFFNDGLKVGQFGDVIFFNKSVFSNDLVKLGKYFFVDLRLSEDFSHAPFNCARRGVGSSDEHVLHMPPPAKLGAPTTSRISDTISFNSLPSFLVLSKRLFEHTRLLTRLAETTKVESAMLAGVLDFQAEYRFVRRPWTCKEI